MRTIETIATISPTGDIHLDRSNNLPVGRFQVVLIIDESPMSDASPISQATEAPSLPHNSFLAVAGDIIGSLEGLPPDLSYNKVYLEDLGKS